jgi:hypothetical protein
MAKIFCQIFTTYMHLVVGLQINCGVFYPNLVLS